MSYIETNNAYFKKSAPKYDRNTRVIQSTRRLISQLAKAQDMDNVLDVATGTGAVAIEMAQIGCQVVGIDLSDDMLNQACNNSQHLNNISFQQADASSLKFDSAYFDIVTISFALHDMPIDIRNKCMHEMLRVLKPGGKLVIMDYHLPNNKFWRLFTHSVIRMYEGDSYKEFIQKNLTEYLKQFPADIAHHQTCFYDVAQVFVLIKP